MTDTKRVQQQLQQYIDYLIENSDAKHPMWNIEMIRSGKENKWNYIDGCMITAVLQLYNITKDEKYLRFADDFIGFFVQEDGSITTYNCEEYNLDNINPGKTLFTLYRLTGKEKYRKATDTIYAQLKTMPRTKEGNFWHKAIYPNQVWLDGLYMAQPFYMEYETSFNNMQNCMDIYRQFCNVEAKMKDEETGLYYHGYDESREMYWADKTTGCSQNFWLRALGWFVMALTDTLEKMDEQMYYEYRYLQSMLKSLVESIVRYQDESGMFYQIIDKKDAPGNYLETSGSAIIAYGILKAVRLGYLPGRFLAYGKKAFYGTIEKYLTVSAQGALQLGGICLVAGLGGAQKRDGSLAYYFSEPVVENEAKGVAPLLLAYTEILQIQE
ncbi:MAG: glycoside hydrolase family 88 protein [Oscillospiraceae bacterium]|nr:glycoside hydrolase family 88 protein [Oscillospiraceae bacterium]